MRKELAEGNQEKEYWEENQERESEKGIWRKESEKRNQEKRMYGTVEYYDKTAAQWAEKGYAGDSELECLPDFLNMLPRGARVLDLCCGAGYETKRIADLGYKAVGIDLSGESIKIARQKNPTISFYQEDMLNDYSYVGAVDGIIVIAGLVHIETTKLSLAFRRMREALKRDGMLLVSVREGVGKIDGRSLCEIDGEQYDRNFIAHTLEELKRAAEGLFVYQREMNSDMPAVWKYYVFKRT